MATKLMPLRKVVVEITSEAEAKDSQGIKKAVKAWHNRLSIGSIPRSLIRKLGKSLYLDLNAWEKWLEEGGKEGCVSRPGRPRNV
ncbi:MAG: hypothetical protein ACLQPD_29275 [Desulfomonilaceae bacterium]